MNGSVHQRRPGRARPMNGSVRQGTESARIGGKPRSGPILYARYRMAEMLAILYGRQAVMRKWHVAASLCQQSSCFIDVTITSMNLYS